MLPTFARLRVHAKTILAVSAALVLTAMMGFGCNQQKPVVAVGPPEAKKEERPGPQPDPRQVEDPPAPKKEMGPKEEFAFGKPATPQEDDPPAGRDLVSVPRLAWEPGADIKAMAISPDCSIVAVATEDKKISYVDVKTGKVRMSFPVNEHIDHLAFSPDGTVLAGRPYFQSLVLWNARTGDVVHTLKDPDPKMQFAAFTSFHFNADGSKLFTANNKGAVQVWNLKNGTHLRTFEEQATDEFFAKRTIAITQDGTRLALLGKKDDIVILDAESGTVQQRRKLDGGKALVIAFGPNNDHVFVGCGKSVERFNLKDEKDVKVMPTSGEVQFLMLSPSGKSLVAGGQFSEIDILNAATGAMRFHMEKGMLTGMPALALGADGKTLASAEKKKVQVWNLQTGPYERALLSDEQQRDERIWVVAGTGRGDLVAVATDKGTVIYDCKTGAKKKALPELKTDTLTIAPDGKRIAFREDGPAEIYDVEKGTRTSTEAFVPSRTTVLGMNVAERQPIQFSPDGKLLAGGEGATLALWRDGKTQRLSGHRLPIMSLAFSTDSKWLATGGKDGKVLVWDLTKPAKKWELDTHEQVVQHVVISSDGGTLAAAGGKDDPTVVLHDLATGKEKIRWHVDYAKEGIHGIDFSPDGKFLALSQGKTLIEIYDTATGKLDRVAPGHFDVFLGADQALRSLGGGRFASYETTHRRHVLIWNWDTLLKESLSTRSPRPAGAPEPPLGFATKLQQFGDMPKGVKQMRYSPDGKLLALVAEKTVTLIDAKTGAKVRELETDADGNRAALFTPDSNTLITAGGGKVIKLWDLTGGKLQRSLTEHTIPITSLAIAANGKILVSGAGSNEKKELIFWDLPALTVRKAIKEQVEGIYSLAPQPNSNLVAAGSADGKIYVYNAETAAIAKTFDGGVKFMNSVAFSFDGKTLAAFQPSNLFTGTPGKLSIWDFESAKLIHGFDERGKYESELFFGPFNHSLFVHDKSNLTIWDVPSGKPRVSLTRFHSLENEIFGASYGVHAVAIAPDNKTLATYSSYDGALKLWRLADLYDLPLQKMMGAVMRLGGKADFKDGVLNVNASVRGRLTAAVLEEIAAAPYPLHLTLSDSVSLNDNDLARLKGAKNLKQLDLIGAPYLGDDGLKHVGQIVNLEVLKIDSPRVTDAGLGHLHKLTNLKTLELFDSGSPKAIEKLKKAIPGLNVMQ